MNGSQYIKVYDDVMPSEFCDMLRELYVSHPDEVSVGKTTNGIHKTKKSLDFFLRRFTEDDPDRRFLLDDTMGFLEDAKNRYLEDFPSIAKATDFSLRQDFPKMKRYIKGVGQYGVHIDTDPNVADREVVVIIYLNDVEEGGETDFPLQNVRVNPVKGSALVFPPFWTFPHQSMKAVSGDKFMVSSFFHMS